MGTSHLDTFATTPAPAPAPFFDLSTLFKKDMPEEDTVAPTPVAVEMADGSGNPVSVGADAEQQPGHQPESMVWMMQAAGRRDSIGDLSPDNPRLSRQSTNVASDEDVAIEMAEEKEADKVAGVDRPDNYTKLGGKLPFRVPRVPDDLTAGWLTTALRFKKHLTDDASVTAVTYKPIGEGGGVMGVIVLLKLTLSENAPSSCPKSMVAKFTPQGKLPIPRFMLRAAFTAESHFYNDFTVAGGGMSRPECYFAMYDKPRRKPTFCMLLEDMMPATAYTRVGSCDEVEKLHAAIATLAKLHARWWNHPKSPPLNWLVHPTQDFGGLLINGFKMVTVKGLAALSKCYGQTYAPILAWQPILKRRHKFILSELMRPVRPQLSIPRPSARPIPAALRLPIGLTRRPPGRDRAPQPLTMIHGDAHIENVFYDARFPGSCAFIDFGNMMFSQGMYDVAFFMAHRCPRDAHQRTCTRTYTPMLHTTQTPRKHHARSRLPAFFRISLTAHHAHPHRTQPRRGRAPRPRGIGGQALLRGALCQWRRPEDLPVRALLARLQVQLLAHPHRGASDGSVD